MTKQCSTFFSDAHSELESGFMTHDGGSNHAELLRLGSIRWEGYNFALTNIQPNIKLEIYNSKKKRDFSEQLTYSFTDPKVDDERSDAQNLKVESRKPVVVRILKEMDFNERKIIVKILNVTKNYWNLLKLEGKLNF